jgi:cell division protein FtsQ
MRQLISKKIIIYLFLFFILVTVNSDSILKLSLPQINKIEVSGLDYEESEKIKRIIKSLVKGNIFLVDNKNIENEIYSLKIIEEFKIFKKYPSTLQVKVKKTEYLAITTKEGLKYYVGSNGELIEDETLVENLPYIFGNLNTQEFFNLKNEIENSDFYFNQILNLYFYKSNRWDIETIDGYLIKLPRNNVKEKLNLFVRLRNEEYFNDKFIIDLRQKNQIILDEK